MPFFGALKSANKSRGLLSQPGSATSLFSDVPRGYYDGPVLKPYEPTMREKVQNALSDTLSNVVPRREANALAKRVVSFGGLLSPVDPTARQEELRMQAAAIRNGQYGRAIGHGLLGDLAMLPVVGKARGPIKAATKRAVKATSALDLSDPWKRAEHFGEVLKKRGVQVGSPRLSTNRYGEKSAYLPSEYGELRFSDHGANMDFRPGQVHVVESDPDKFLKNARRAQEAAVAKHAAEQAEEARRLAPAKEAFANAGTDQDRALIIAQTFPGRSRDDRRYLRQQWEKELGLR